MEVRLHGEERKTNESRRMPGARIHGHRKENKRHRFKNSIKSKDFFFSEKNIQPMKRIVIKVIRKNFSMKNLSNYDS